MNVILHRKASDGTKLFRNAVFHRVPVTGDLLVVASETLRAAMVMLGDLTTPDVTPVCVYVEPVAGIANDHDLDRDGWRTVEDA
jgi:hypothetical protein